jgi:hypothetical protein
VAHPDLDRLLKYCLPFAQDQILQSGAFVPFAASLQRDGEVSALAVNDGKWQLEAQAMIGEFTAILKDMAVRRRILGGAICFDSKVGKRDDPTRKQVAIAVSLEHENGECMTVYVPYRKKMLGGYKYEPIIAVASDRKLFV